MMISICYHSQTVTISTGGPKCRHGQRGWRFKQRVYAGNEDGEGMRRSGGGRGLRGDGRWLDWEEWSWGSERGRRSETRGRVMAPAHYAAFTVVRLLYWSHYTTLCLIMGCLEVARSDSLWETTRESSFLQKWRSTRSEWSKLFVCWFAVKKQGRKRKEYEIIHIIIDLLKLQVLPLLPSDISLARYLALWLASGRCCCHCRSKLISHYRIWTRRQVQIFNHRRISQIMSLTIHT